MKKIIAVLLTLLIVFAFASCNKNDNETDANNLTINVEEIKADNLICIGSLELSDEKELIIDVTAESGTGLFVGVTGVEGLTDTNAGWWVKVGGEEETNTIHSTHSAGNGKYYVYIGSEFSDIANITGSIVYA